MPEFTRDDFSVAVAQRRLLEAIGSYGGDLGVEGQATVLSALAKGVMGVCLRMEPGNDDVIDIYCGLAELLLAVAHDRLDVAEREGV